MEALGCPGVRGGGWLDLMPLSRRTVDKYERLLRLHLEPELGSVELVDTWTKSRAWARSNARAACRRRAPRRTAQVPAGPLQSVGSGRRRPDRALSRRLHRSRSGRRSRG